MPNQKESIYTQNTSITTHQIDNEESRKIVSELNLEDKMSIDGTLKQDEETNNKESGKIDETEQKPEEEISSNKTSEQENENYNKESGKMEDTDQKTEDEISFDNTSEQANGMDNTDSEKIDDTEQEPEDTDFSEKQENRADNTESHKIDDTEQKPEVEISSNKTSEVENENDNKESGKMEDTDQKTEDEISFDNTSDQANGMDNTDSEKIDDTEQEPEGTDPCKKQDNRADNTESHKIEDTDQKTEDEISFDNTSDQANGMDNTDSEKIDDTEQEPEGTDPYKKQENRADNTESHKIDDTEQKPDDKVTFAKISTQEDGTDNEESGKIDGELEDKICNINTSRTDDGPPPAIKINNVEFGESSATRSIQNEMWIGNEQFGGSSVKLSIKEEMLNDNEEFGECSETHSFEDETYINYNTFASDGRILPTTNDENHTGEMGMCSTSGNTVNSRKRYQSPNEELNEGLNENEQFVLKKIKIENSNDDLFYELWKCVEYDYSDFPRWENLLHLVDEQNIEVNARMAYNKFLAIYPLCCGYWKKYANFEKRNNNINEFEKILTDGLNAIPISVDLWIYYLTYLRTERYSEVEYIRNEFERSLKLCGLDCHSDQLWHDYISWEVERNELFNAAQIYYRLIRTPTFDYLKNFFKFQGFIFNQLPLQYLGLEEFLRRRSIVVRSLINHNREPLNDDSIPPREDFQQESDMNEMNLMSILRIEIIEEWYNFHKQTAKEFESRKIFEENIRRRHFHVNELEIDQITNWENYIKFERRAGDHERVINLYERCLVACASIEEFWLNYLEYLFFINVVDVGSLTDVFKRSLFHHPKSLLLNLKYFDFSEAQGWEEIAVETITHLELIHPDSKDVAIKRINLARKNKDSSLAILYKNYLNNSQSKSFSSFIAVRYARFIWKHDRHLSLAYDILYETIRNYGISVNDSLEIYLTLVELKMELNPKDHFSVLKTIDDIILQCNLQKEKLLFSKKKVEYAEDYIQDYNILRLAKIEHRHLKNACLRERKQLSNNTM